MCACTCVCAVYMHIHVLYMCVCVCMCVSESGRLDSLQPIKFFGRGRRVYVIDILNVTTRSSGTPATQLAFKFHNNIMCPALRNFQFVFVVCTCSLLCMWSNVYTCSLSSYIEQEIFHHIAGKLGRELKFDGLVVCLAEQLPKVKFPQMSYSI